MIGNTQAQYSSEGKAIFKVPLGRDIRAETTVEKGIQMTSIQKQIIEEIEQEEVAEQAVIEPVKQLPLMHLSWMPPPGITISRDALLKIAYDAGRNIALHWRKGFFSCPVRNDPELAAEWQKGADSVPVLGSRAFAAGRDFGLLGIASPLPDDPALASLWAEGEAEGKAKAANTDPDELYFARSFRSRQDGNQLISRKDAFELGKQMVLEVAKNDLICPYEAESDLEEHWLKGVEYAQARDYKLQHKSKLSESVDTMLQKACKKQTQEQTQEQTKQVNPFRTCPFRDGTTAKQVFLVLANALTPLTTKAMAKDAGVELKTAFNFVAAYSGKVFGYKLRRNGMELRKEGKGWMLRTVEPDLTAKLDRKKK